MAGPPDAASSPPVGKVCRWAQPHESSSSVSENSTKPEPRSGERQCVDKAKGEQVCVERTPDDPTGVLGVCDGRGKVELAPLMADEWWCVGFGFACGLGCNVGASQVEIVCGSPETCP